MTDAPSIRERIVTEAREWLGTRKFQHQARMKGVAVDCAGLVIGVCRNLGLLPPDFDVTGYAPVPDGVSFLAFCDQHMTRIDATAAQPGQPGDAVVVRYDSGPQHVGILCPYRYGGLAFIQATRRGVIETRLLFGNEPKAMTYVASYRLPGVPA